MRSWLLRFMVRGALVALLMAWPVTPVEAAGASSHCTIIGTSSNDRLVGSSGVDVICGRRGDDRIIGLGGNDRLVGGRGDDLIWGGEGADTLLGRTGSDEAHGGAGEDLIGGGPGEDTTLSGAEGRDRIRGGAGQDTLWGGTRSDALFGAEGSDTLRGESGNDVLAGGLGGDALYGGEGSDSLSGGAGINGCPDASSSDNVTGCDAMAPQLENFSLSPASVDTSAQRRFITIRAQITDDLSGIGSNDSPSQVRFSSPSGEQHITAFFEPSSLVSGTHRDGIFEDTVVVRHLSEQGTWSLTYLLLVDDVGNRRSLNRAEVRAAGFPATFEQLGEGDTTAPTLVDFSISPSRVDTSTSDRTLSFSAWITDETNSCASDAPSQVRFEGRSGQRVTATFGEDHLSSGTCRNGLYSDEVVLPRFSEQGTWHVRSFMLIDELGNRDYLDEQAMSLSGLPTTFEQLGRGDVEPPRLAEFSIRPADVRVGSGDARVILRARFVDDYSGVRVDDAPCQVRFRSPSGGQYVTAVFSPSNLIEGTWQNGTFEDQVTIKSLAERGTWRIEYFLLIDRAGNRRWLSADDVAALGMPDSFGVRS